MDMRARVQLGAAFPSRPCTAAEWNVPLAETTILSAQIGQIRMLLLENSSAQIGLSGPTVPSVVCQQGDNPTSRLLIAS